MRVMVLTLNDGALYLNEAGGFTLAVGGARVSGTIPYHMVRKIFADYDDGKSFIAHSLGSAFFELGNAKLEFSFKNMHYRGQVRSMGIAELEGMDSPF